MASIGKVILSEGDTCIRESELRTLKDERGWLNDILIDFYFQRLAKDHKDVKVRLYHPGLSQFLKMDVTDPREILGDPEPKDIDYAFWAINDSREVRRGVSGSHWSLLVFSRPDDGFFYLDSTSGDDKDAKKLYVNLRVTFSKTAGYQRMKCWQQNNANDCGLHVLANAQNILNFIQTYHARDGRLPKIGEKAPKVATATPEQAKKMRAHLLKIISPS